jgi:KDO2-lipid IV(A) lauroyltransferase
MASSLANRCASLCGILFFRATALLPLSVSRAMGRLLGFLYYKLADKRVHISRVNIRICFPNLSASEQELMVKRSLMAAGEWFFETGAILLWPSKKLLKNVEVVNMELFEQALANKCGVIVTMQHLGNWEFMGMFVTQYCEFTCLHKREVKYQVIDDFVLKHRSNRGALMASADNSGVRHLYRQLKAGKAVGLTPDHAPNIGAGLFAPFFGRPTFSGTLVASLARKSGACVLAATALRTAKGFEVHFASVDDQHNPDPLVAVTQLNATVEKCIALKPEQYQWAYARFKKCQDPDAFSPYEQARPDSH